MTSDGYTLALARTDVLRLERDQALLMKRQAELEAELARQCSARATPPSEPKRWVRCVDDKNTFGVVVIGSVYPVLHEHAIGGGPPIQIEVRGERGERFWINADRFVPCDAPEQATGEREPECEHGSLRRVCLTCELQSELATERTKSAQLAEELEAHKRDIADLTERFQRARRQLSAQELWLSDAAEALGEVREEDSAPYVLTYAEVLEKIRELREERDEFRDVGPSWLADATKALGQVRPDGEALALTWTQVLAAIREQRAELDRLRGLGKAVREAVEIAKKEFTYAFLASGMPGGGVVERASLMPDGWQRILDAARTFDATKPGDAT